MFRCDLRVLDPQEQRYDPVLLEQPADHQAGVAVDPLQEQRGHHHQLQPRGEDLGLHGGRQGRGEVLQGQVAHPQLALVLGQLGEQLVQVLGPLHRAGTVPAVQKNHLVLGAGGACWKMRQKLTFKHSRQDISNMEGQKSFPEHDTYVKYFHKMVPGFR